MKKNSSAVIAVVILLAGLIGLLVYRNKQPAELDGFAQCLKDSGVVFYGAFWCPHCQNEKKLFGRSERLLPYIECSTPDGQGQTIACTDKKIESYPTWEFKDGRRQTGELSLPELAAKSGCKLPR